MSVQERLNDALEASELLTKEINEAEELKISLESNQIIIKYLSIINKISDLKSKEMELDKTIYNLKIKLCKEKYGGHFYVVDRQKSNGSWPKETMVTCIHCGVKENINEHIYVERDTRDCLSPTTERLLINVHGFYVDDELEEVKKIYDGIKERFPGALDDDIGKQISFVKKMKGGKLC